MQYSIEFDNSFVAFYLMQTIGKEARFPLIGGSETEKANVDYFKNKQILAVRGRIEGGIRRGNKRLKEGFLTWQRLETAFSNSFVDI